MLIGDGLCIWTDLKHGKSKKEGQLVFNKVNLRMEQVENKMKQSFDRMLELEVRFTVAALKGDIFS